MASGGLTPGGRVRSPGGMGIPGGKGYGRLIGPSGVKQTILDGGLPGANDAVPGANDAVPGA